MNKQQLFQERPKDTSACTLVKDTVDSAKVRNFIKEKVFEKLNPTDENYVIEENEFQWSVTQRFVAKPAMINVRLRSYHKGMKLIAYNSFEIYHGDCGINKMRVSNELTEAKLEAHVDDAIKSFKEQLKFGEAEAREFKKEHKKQLAQEKKLNEKLEKIFKGINFDKNEDGLVRIWNRYSYNAEKGTYVQLSEVAKCNVFYFTPKSVKPAEDSQEKMPDKINGKRYPFLVANFHNNSQWWSFDIHNLDVKSIVDLFEANKNGTKITIESSREEGGKRVDLYTPRFSVHCTNNRNNVDGYYRAHSECKLTTSYSHVAKNTQEFMALVNKLKLHVWKIERD